MRAAAIRVKTADLLRVNATATITRATFGIEILGALE
jgi:hypothetical protein